MRIGYRVGFVVLVSLLCACGGGGGSSPAPSGGGPAGGGTPTPVGATPTPTPVGMTPTPIPTPTPVGMTPTPTPTPTPVPTPTPSPTPRGRAYGLPPPTPVVQSAYTIDSNPHGLAVSVDGTAIGNTPQNATPAFAAKAHVITIAPSSGTPYTVAAPQTANGAHAVFYNQQLDTAGKIASIASSSVQRRTASVQHPFPGV
ncbi:MAG: PEGA domain-containing protein, partial [Candidatus Eremiobacteraeota bacterium]|nr:PEGA domain-containing protein [Candidatus Eremiobacteraeota bacterium]